MKTIIKTYLLFIAIVLGCLGLLPKAQAVSPPPDGGYPGGNTAEGQGALLSLTSGEFNTAVGFFSLATLTEGSFNTALGAGTLFTNIGGSNTAIGTGALLSNTVGFGNTANGAFALFGNTTGVTNAANGYQALFSNTSGNQNTAIGTGALFTNTIGQTNTATGLGALASNVIGSGNTANGADALGVSTGNGNTALGEGAGSNVTTANNVICIGTSAANVNNSCFIGNIRGITTQNNDALPVLIDSVGQLGTISSSRRYKTDIKPMDSASESILSLKPVSFRYKVHKDSTSQFGLIAEEVAEVNPDLVVRDKNGEIYTVRYDAVNAMLLNEFLKEHRKVQEQQATIAQLQTRMDALAAHIKEQDSKIQKVSDQVELTKPAARLATTKQAQ